MGQCMLLHIPTRMYSISSEGSMTSYKGTQHAKIVAVKKMDAYRGKTQSTKCLVHKISGLYKHAQVHLN